MTSTALTGPSRGLGFTAFQSWHCAVTLTFPASQKAGVVQWRPEVVEICLWGENWSTTPKLTSKLSKGLININQSWRVGRLERGWVSAAVLWISPRMLMTFFRSPLHCHCVREEFLRRLTRRWGGGEPGGKASLKSGEERCISSKAIRRLPVTLARAVLFEWNCFLLIPSLLQHHPPS